MNIYIYMYILGGKPDASSISVLRQQVRLYLTLCSVWKVQDIWEARLYVWFEVRLGVWSITAVGSTLSSVEVLRESTVFISVDCFISVHAQTCIWRFEFYVVRKFPWAASSTLFRRAPDRHKVERSTLCWSYPDRTKVERSTLFRSGADRNKNSN